MKEKLKIEDIVTGEVYEVAQHPTNKDLLEVTTGMLKGQFLHKGRVRVIERQTVQNSKRPKISQEVIDGFASIVDSQDRKGFAKYGKSIDDAQDSDHDWKSEALEEMADYSKYLVRELHRIERENEILRETVKFLVDKSHKPKIREGE